MSGLALAAALLSAAAAWTAYYRASNILAQAEMLVLDRQVVADALHAAQLALEEQAFVLVANAGLLRDNTLADAVIEDLKSGYGRVRSEASEAIEQTIEIWSTRQTTTTATGEFVAASRERYAAFDAGATHIFNQAILERRAMTLEEVETAEQLENEYRAATSQALKSLASDSRNSILAIDSSATTSALITSIGSLAGFGLLAVAGAWVGRRRIIESITPISAALQKLAAGDSTAVLMTGGGEKFAPLETAFNSFKTRMVQLRDAETELEKQTFIADQMFDAVVVHDLEGRITACNTAAETMAGQPRSAMIGQNLTELIRDQDFHEITRPHMRQQVSSGKIATAELTLPTPGGGRLLCEVTATGVRDRLGNTVGFLSIIRDIGERRRQEEIVQRQAAVIDQMTEGVFITNLEGKIVYSNPAHERMFGYAKEDVLGKTPTFLSADPNFESRRQAIMSIPRHTPIEVEVRARRADGSELLTSASGRGLKNAGGEYVGRVFLVRDITELRTKEQQLRQSQKMEAVGQLTGGIAHDFNNLLGILLLNLQLIEGRIGADDVSKNLAARSLRAVDRGARLVQQMLAFSRRQTLSPISIRLEVLLSEMNDLLRRALPANIELSFETPTDLWSCEADKTQIETALLNLAINARDAMPKGGALAFKCRNETITPEMVRENAEFLPGEFVCIEIADTGFGIPENQLSQVIEPFFTTKDVGKGTGLGLSMVYGFIKQSRGNFKIKSSVGVGTTVLLYLPRLRVPMTRDPASQDTAKLAEANQARILLVEDDDDMRESTRQHLLLLGYVVIAASDGPGALNELAQNPGITILIADIMLTGPLNGIQLAEQALAKWPKLKVLHVSGYSDEILMANGRLKHDVTLLRKPYNRQALAEAVAKLERRDSPVA